MNATTIRNSQRSRRQVAAVLCILTGVWGFHPDLCRSEDGDAAAQTLTADTPWVVAEGQPEPVERALDDVMSDWYKIFGHRPVVLRQSPPSSRRGPVIYLGLNGAWRDSMLKDLPAGPESFVLRLQKDPSDRSALVAGGADVRGSIYAAYAFSEMILGVDPWRHWVDKEPAPRDRIKLPAALNEQFGPPSFKYRGWFINDEDLLNAFAPDPLRENVFSLEMYDRIYETILRLRGNMIVPATFPFPDERCQELAARRGLVLNMHHILVLGLNTYRWPKDVPFSYSKHPEIMERYWQTCIDAFQGKEVVWTVGYRGKHDQPFWVDEPELKDPAARGAVMTSAIAKQVELIRRVDPKAPIIANLWAEGVGMLRAGQLKLPEGVITVWPDGGDGILCDKGTVKAGQGIYYHTAMLSFFANQLTEMVDPARIYGELGRFARADAREFFLVNVSDVRPVPLSTDCAMKFAWNCDPFLNKNDGENMTAFLLDWSRRQYGDAMAAEIAAVYADYFNIRYQQRDQRRGEHYVQHQLKMLNEKAGSLIRAGKPLTDEVLKEAARVTQFASENRPYANNLLQKAQPLAERVPEDRKAFYQSHVLTQIRIHLHSLEMLESYGQALTAYGAGDKARSGTQMEAALRAIDDLFVALRQAEYGKWSRWFIGDRMVGLEWNRDQLRLLVAALHGEPPPPTRSFPGYYETICDYQEPFSENFPLLYPKKAAGSH